MSTSPTKLNWLEKPETGNRIFWGLVIAAVLVAMPDILALFEILYETHPYTTIEEIPVFYGLYGVIGFLTLIVIAKAVQPFLCRTEDYYD